VSDTTNSLAKDPTTILSLGGLELRLDHPLHSETPVYTLTGRLQGGGADLFCDGGSLQIQNAATGLVEEAFFAADGRFTQELTLAPDADSRFTVALCDGLGDIAAAVPVTVRHRGQGPSAAPNPGTPTLPRALTVGLRSRGGQRRQQVLAPAGAALPGRFSCVCKTTDQTGRVVVPLWEEGRLLHQMIVGEIDPNMPPGCPVEIELQVAADRAMTLRVLVRHAGRGETVQLPAPAPPERPTPEVVDLVVCRIEELLAEFTGQYGSQLRESLQQQRTALVEALAADQVERAAAALAALQEQRQQMELAKLQVRYPPPQRLTQLVKRCLFEAANVADRTGRDRDQLFAQIYAREQAAEQAVAENNAGLYRECFEQLQALADDLQRVQEDLLPMSRRDLNPRPNLHEALDLLKDLQAYLAVVMAAAELLGRKDLEERLQALQRKCEELAERAKKDAAAALREGRRALAEVAELEQAVGGGRPAGGEHAGLDGEGMLEGSA
jgi:hypothetical protein